MVSLVVLGMNDFASTNTWVPQLVQQAKMKISVIEHNSRVFFYGAGKQSVVGSKVTKLENQPVPQVISYYGDFFPSNGLSGFFVACRKGQNRCSTCELLFGRKYR